jgi:uncharacterized membrane protein
METQYKVVTDGKLCDGVDAEQFVQAFVQAFKVTDDQARKLLATGQTVTLKDNLDKATAEKFQRVLEGQIGLQVRLVPKESLSLGGESAPAGTGARCPKCGSDRVEGDECLACGVIISRYLARQAQMAEEKASIYAPPSADVSPGNKEYADGEFELRKLAAGNGLHWITGGWRHFTGNPGAWIVAFIIWILIGLVAGLIPFLGSLAINILSPVFIAGFMLGASEQEHGGDFTIQHLFAGFSADFGKLVIAGLLYLGAAIIVVAITFAIIALTGFGSFMQQAEAGSFGQGPGVISILVLSLVVSTLLVVMTMAFWFVPLLVVFDGIAPLQAIPLSFSACWKNVMPFLIYGLVATGLAFVAMIPLGLGLIVLAPVMMASIYVSYRDIFHGVAPAA